MRDTQQNKVYTCTDYREEMILAGLRKRLQQPDLKEEERLQLIQEIEELEKQIGLS